MAHDARRKGLDKTEAFTRSHALALGNLMLIKLREQILAEAPAPTEDELRAFCEEHKHRFRSPPPRAIRGNFARDPKRGAPARGSA